MKRFAVALLSITVVGGCMKGSASDPTADPAEPAAAGDSPKTTAAAAPTAAPPADDYAYRGDLGQETASGQPAFAGPAGTDQGVGFGAKNPLNLAFESTITRDISGLARDQPPVSGVENQKAPQVIVLEDIAIMGDMEQPDLPMRVTEESRGADHDRLRRSAQDETAAESGLLGKLGGEEAGEHFWKEDDGRAVDGRYKGMFALSNAPPDEFIPNTCYVANTYLGGNAGYIHSLRRLDAELGPVGSPHRLSKTPPQGFDPPRRAGMAVAASLSTRWLERPGRVFLQIGLRGSERFGWRRPPLQLVLVVDGPALSDGGVAAASAIRALLRRLGSKDRLAVVVSGQTPTVLAPLSRVRSLRSELVPRLRRHPQQHGGPGHLAAALTRAGALLRETDEETSASVHGTQIVLTLTRGSSREQAKAAYNVAHAMTLRGVVTSIIELGLASEGGWFETANAGYGNYYNPQTEDLAPAIEEELDSISRVVARLVRLNVRLAPGVKAIRVLGSHVLDQRTVREVKEREEATDLALSQREGIAADRGDDDDGIQTVIPYFYGGDSHVVMIELWVEKPGPVADVSLKFKDMVTLGNSTARTAVSLRNVPRQLTGEEHLVHTNLQGFGIADSLQRAASLLAGGDGDSALQVLSAARSGSPAVAAQADRELLDRFQQLLGGGAWRSDARARQALARGLAMASIRRIGGTGG